jgi:hypothetical protein
MLRSPQPQREGEAGERKLADAWHGRQRFVRTGQSQGARCGAFGPSRRGEGLLSVAWHVGRTGFSRSRAISFAR